VGYSTPQGIVAAALAKKQWADVRRRLALIDSKQYMFIASMPVEVDQVSGIIHTYPPDSDHRCSSAIGGYQCLITFRYVLLPRCPQRQMFIL